MRYQIQELLFHRVAVFLLSGLLVVALDLAADAGINRINGVTTSEAYLAAPIVRAIKNHAAVPVLSVSNGELKDLSVAYRVQKTVVDVLLNNLQPAGFKAGLTSADTQQRFAATEPVAGVLLTEIKISSARKLTVSSALYRRGVIELEIGYRLNQRVTAPVKDVVQLQQLIAEVVAVIELPETGFAAKPRLGDIVATNVGARHYLIAGAVKKNPDRQQLNAIAVRLQRGDQLLMQGSGADALGDQWRALQFLINRTIASGWYIEPHQLLITGALGTVVPMQAGSYHASWSGLAEQEFVIE